MELLNRDIRDYENDDIGDEGYSPVKDMEVFCFNNKTLRITMLKNFYDYIGVELVDGCMKCKKFEGFDFGCYDCNSMQWGISEDLELSLLAILDDTGCDGNEFEVFLYFADESIMVEMYPISDEEEVSDITQSKYILKPYICKDRIWIPAIKQEFLNRKKYNK